MKIASVNEFTLTIYKQRADSTAIVRAGDGPVALLAGGIPDLSFDSLGLNVNVFCGKLDANGGFRFQVELIALGERTYGELRQQIGLANARVPDEDQLEQVVVLVVGHHLCGRPGSAHRRSLTKG
ncbi:hypothetical protein BC936DRAFT_139925 [Jimgerdemannia flammicorona]|uniref:Uncharacterized protein n=2 Tax=Jimgerdemannia flammicorona TaxID=994334 RepID=A0A433Q4C7_9FUNG|nr:hypothetical protein BC936DRAFT_139925 [Jimgerdemannia flammicorona]RUS24673.1 hypothetical protein BC938DRAFT_473249 [Jimgerdemannia flammicorona]